MFYTLNLTFHDFINLYCHEITVSHTSTNMFHLSMSQPRLFSPYSGITESISNMLIAIYRAETISPLEAPRFQFFKINSALL